MTSEQKVKKDYPIAKFYLGRIWIGLMPISRRYRLPSVRSTVEERAWNNGQIYT